MTIDVPPNSVITLSDVWVDPPPDVFKQDMADIRKAAAVLVGYPTGPIPSVGTAIEIGYAYALGKPIIVWLPRGQDYVHPFIPLCSSAWFTDLRWAVNEVIALIGEGSVLQAECSPPAIGGGIKHDADKLPFGLLPRAALEQVAGVLAHGSVKYGRHNWRKGIAVQRNIDAALRHIFAANEGEENDPDSGLPHFAHAVCDLMFVIETLRARPDLDDRFHRIDLVGGQYSAS